MRLTRLVLPVLLALAPNLAWSHAALTRSVPGNREVLVRPPERLQLKFNEKVEAQFSTVRLEAADGTPQPLGTPEASASDPYQLEAAVNAPLAAGKYTVHYRVLSQDGHVIERSYSFTLKASDPAP